MNSIQSQDSAIFDLLQKETTRQNDNLELIASENFASKAVMEATNMQKGILENDTMVGVSLPMLSKTWQEIELKNYTVLTG
jgi:hypothetical protein